MTSSEVELLFEYVQRVEELKRIIATQIERLDELETNNENLHATGKALLRLLEDLDGRTAKQAEALITRRLTELVETFGGDK